MVSEPVRLVAEEAVPVKVSEVVPFEMVTQWELPGVHFVPWPVMVMVSV